MPFTSLNLQQFKEVFLQALLALPRFLKNPVQGMKDLPDWEWPIILALQATLGLACGVVAAILSRSILLIFTSIIIAPISTVAVNLILSGFFYYTFLFFFKKEVSYRLLATHMLFASIPVLLCNIIAPIIPLISILGVVASGILLYVGFRENIQADDKKLRYLVGGLVLFYVLSVGVQMIKFNRPDRDMKIRATPESIDILEQELQGE